MSRVRLIGVPDAAVYLGISRTRAYQLARENQLPGLRRLGARQYRVSVAELEAFLGAPAIAAAVNFEHGGER
jgi:excisionase family DNA binding protein